MFAYVLADHKKIPWTTTYKYTHTHTQHTRTHTTHNCIYKQHNLHSAHSLLNKYLQRIPIYGIGRSISVVLFTQKLSFQSSF